jgi:hypothetical protein
MTADIENLESTSTNHLKVTSARPHISLTLITVLLALILLVHLYQVGAAWERNSRRSQKVKDATALVEKQQFLISGLVVAYRGAAYDNSKVNRIAEQQLIATEYTLQALQVLGIQNSQIIELLADAPY